MKSVQRFFENSDQSDASPRTPDISIRTPQGRMANTQMIVAIEPLEEQSDMEIYLTAAASLVNAIPSTKAFLTFGNSGSSLLFSRPPQTKTSSKMKMTRI